MKTKTTKPPKANPAEKYQQIADYLQLKYSLRYNELRLTGEFYDEATGQYKELHEFHLNSWFVELKNNGFAITDQVLKKVTASNLIPVVNLDDQLDDYTWREYEGLKAIVTSTTITSRKAYARNDANRPRRASIVASTNNPNFLVDTQNRRYLVFTAAHIDYQTKVDMDQVYAQAQTLFKQGERYWLDSEEQQELDEVNARYRMATMEEELIAKYLKPAQNDEVNVKWLTSTEIKSALEIHSSIKNLSLRLIGLTLKKAGFPRKNVKDEGKAYGVYKWGVITQF